MSYLDDLFKIFRGQEANDTTGTKARDAAEGLNENTDRINNALAEIDEAAEKSENKVQDLSSPSTTTYTSSQAVANALEGIQTSNENHIANELANYQPTSEKGAANGYAGLDENTLIPAAYLPGFVDDIIEGEYIDATTFNDEFGDPVTGESGKIYVDITQPDPKPQYRWSGSQFTIQIQTPGTTDQVPEGTINKYFTLDRVRTTVLSGFEVVTGFAVNASDNILTAFGKLQGQINTLTTALNNKLNKGTYNGDAGQLKSLIDTKQTQLQVQSLIDQANNTGLDKRMATLAGDLDETEQDAIKTKLGIVEGGTSRPPVDNADSPYLDVAALIADQNSQLQGYEYLVTDASGFSNPDITSGKAVVLLEASSPTGTEADYLITWSEQFDSFKPANDSEVVKTIETSSGQVLQMDANGKVVLPDFGNGIVGGEVLYNVENYGAVHDGKDVLDGNTTFGSNIFTSGIGVFQSSDVGKVISIKGFTTTISGYTDANTVTLTDSATSTLSGEKWCYGTDDTVAIQSAINAAHADGGGVVYFPKGVYIIAGALKTNVGNYNVNPNSQLWIPYYNADIQDRRTIELRGEVTATLYQALGIANRPAANTGVVLRSTIQGSGTEPSVLASKGGAPNDFNNFNRNNLMVKNISIQITPNASNEMTMCGFNCRDSSIANFENVTVFPYGIDPQSTTAPTTDVTGIIMAKVAGEHINSLTRTTVGGFKNGYKIGEHATAFNAVAICCESGFRIMENNHTPDLNRISAFWCKYDVSIDDIKNDQFSGFHFKIGSLLSEWKRQGVWYDNVATINDPNNNGKGSLGFDIVQSDVGLNNDKFKKIGGQNITSKPITVGEIISQQSASNYTFLKSDIEKSNIFDSSTSITLTIPHSDNVSFDINDKITGYQYGNGGLTIGSESNVTIISGNNTFATVNQYSKFIITQIKLNIWELEIIEATQGGTQNSNTVPTDHLIAYYKFDETSGTTVVDAHGANNGTLSGVTINQVGKIGKCYSFDGNDFLALSALDGLVNNADFSTGCWFKTTQIGVNPYRLMQNRGQGAKGSFAGYAISPWLSSPMHWGNTLVDDGLGNTIDFENVSYNESDDNWHLIILTWSSSMGRARLYIDGVLKSEKTNTNLIGANLTGAGTLFGKSNQNGQYYNGLADELFFYQKELAQSEVDNILNNGNGTTL